MWLLFVLHLVINRVRQLQTIIHKWQPGAIRILVIPSIKPNLHVLRYGKQPSDTLYSCQLNISAPHHSRHRHSLHSSAPSTCAIGPPAITQDSRNVKRSFKSPKSRDMVTKVSHSILCIYQLSQQS
ncbi:hypothetical protein HDV63DRAFT_385717 [Trichoderma sp. SZMC 28014]